VAVAKTGFTISGSSKTVTVYFTDPTTAVTLSSVTANGSSTLTTTELTLTFSASIAELSAADITLSGVSGVTKGSITGSNPYTLPISGFSAGGTLTVAVAKTGFTISGSSKTVNIYYRAVSVTIVTLNKTALILDVGDTETLTATIGPSNATNKNVTWSSSDTSIVTVSNGIVTAVGSGIATITVKTEDGNKTATCTFTVRFTGPITVQNLATHLFTLPVNSASSPHNVQLIVSSASEFNTIKSALKGALQKYVNLDLTGSTTTTIPDKAFYDGYPEIRGYDTLTGITIPSGITSIGEYAIYRCINLTYANIPNTVKSIGDYAFSSCSSLTSIIIPDSVTSLGFATFSGCLSLTSVIIGNGLTSLSGFSDCRDLVSVTIGNSVIDIGGNAFTGIVGGRKIISLIIPSSVKSIGQNAFDATQYSELISITFQGTIPISGFHYLAFGLNSLRDKFYATDPENGTPGTYTRPTNGWTWTLQQ
jgi:hypothetical protein